MGHRKRLGAFAAIPFLTLSLGAQTAEAPAQEPAPIQVVSHWSRWTYPTEVAPAAGQRIHTVVKGDTLWDLGAKYLGNPFAWPQIWELNKWVKDPHWIYPGDPILVEPGRAVVPEEQLAPGEVAGLQPDFRRGRTTPPEYGYSFQDFVQMPYLVPGTAEAYLKSIGAFRIVGQEDPTKNLMADGDYLYLGGGADQGVKAGDRLVVTGVAVRKFYHPDDHRHQTLLGAILEQQGIVRVTQVYPGQSVAIIEHSLDGISATGTYAAPFTDPPALTATLRRDVASPIALQEPVAKVIFIRMDKAVAAGGDLVIIDRGADQGYKLGDVLVSAREVPLVTPPPGARSTSKATTNHYLGQLMVIRSDPRSATCRILRSTSEVMVGDVLSR
jgi:hypothetical protein